MSPRHVPSGPKHERLTRLSSGRYDEHWGSGVVSLRPAALDSLLKLTALRELALALAFDDLQRLSRLPPSAEALTLYAVARIESGQLGWAAAQRGDCDLAAVLEAAGRAPGVRALRVYAPGARLRDSRRLWPAVPRLRVLQVASPHLQLHDISALATMPGLTRLMACDEPWHHAPGLKTSLRPLVAQAAARGLQITLNDAPIDGR